MKKIVERILGIIGGTILGSLLCSPIVGGFIWIDYSLNSWRYNATPTETFIKICFIFGIITWIGFIFVVRNNKSYQKTRKREKK